MEFHNVAEVRLFGATEVDRPKEAHETIDVTVCIYNSSVNLYDARQGNAGTSGAISPGGILSLCHGDIKDAANSHNKSVSSGIASYLQLYRVEGD